jgi:pimeloyl-ACP methyl ester carboxylesterase
MPSNEVLVQAGPVVLSALEQRPPARPRGTLLALHGGALPARYFDAPTDPGASLLTLGAQLGWRVLAVDRPGYGRSQELVTKGVSADLQAGWFAELIDQLAGPVVLVCHSLGALIGLRVATLVGSRIAGIAVAGVPARYTAEQGGDLRGLDCSGDVIGSAPASYAGLPAFGPRGTYDPAVLTAVRSMLSPVPTAEFLAARDAPEQMATVTAGVTVPVLWTFASHEGTHSPESVVEPLLDGWFAASPHVERHHQADSGHNVSLHHIARAYHLRVLSFAEQCRFRAVNLCAAP